MVFRSSNLEFVLAWRKRSEQGDQIRVCHSNLSKNVCGQKQQEERNKRESI